MEYYNPNDNRITRYAALITLAVLALFVGAVSFINITVIPSHGSEVEIVVELAEEVEEVEEPKRPAKKPIIKQSSPTDVRKDKAPVQTKEAEIPKSEQTSGEAEKTQTLNQNALFPAAENTSTETVATGNEFAPEGEVESHHGTGKGYNLEGTDQLDEGLRGRGLREGLPIPDTRYNDSGKVFVLVHVDAKGNVTSAEISMKGTTTTDTTLYRLAIDAAMKAKFNASDTGDNISGKIEYKFNLH